MEWKRKPVQSYMNAKILFLLWATVKITIEEKNDSKGTGKRENLRYVPNRAEKKSSHISLYIYYMVCSQQSTFFCQTQTTISMFLVFGCSTSFGWLWTVMDYTYYTISDNIDSMLAAGHLLEQMIKAHRKFLIQPMSLFLFSLSKSTCIL